MSLFSDAGLSVTTDGDGGPSGSYTMNGVALGAGLYATAAGASFTSSTTAGTALADVTAAIAQLGTDRAGVGANEERLQYTSQALSVLSTNLTAANSQISDVDVATESTKFAKSQILVQSGAAMLAQANQNPQNVLKLIQNL